MAAQLLARRCGSSIKQLNSVCESKALSIMPKVVWPKEEVPETPFSLSLGGGGDFGEVGANVELKVPAS